MLIFSNLLFELLAIQTVNTREFLLDRPTETRGELLDMCLGKWAHKFSFIFIIQVINHPNFKH